MRGKDISTHFLRNRVWTLKEGWVIVCKITQSTYCSCISLRAQQNAHTFQSSSEGCHGEEVSEGIILNQRVMTEPVTVSHMRNFLPRWPEEPGQWGQSWKL